MSDPAVRLVDARGLLCPWPALRLARAVRGQPDGQQYLVLADDPNAARELAALAAAQQWRLEAAGERFQVWT